MYIPCMYRYFCLGSAIPLIHTYFDLDLHSISTYIFIYVMSHRLCSTRSTAQAVMCGAIKCQCTRYGHLEETFSQLSQPEVHCIIIDHGIAICVLFAGST